MYEIFLKTCIFCESDNIKDLFFFNIELRTQITITVILSILSRYRYLTVTEREREGCPK